MPAEAIHAFNTADWSLDNSFLVQLQDPGEAYEVTCPFYVIDHPEGTVAVDTGLSHDLLDDPAGYGQHGAAFMEDFLPYIDYEASMRPRNQLADAGYDVGEVDYLVATHLHSDHAGHVDTFVEAGAEVLVRREELRYAFWPDPIQELFYLEGDFGVLRSDEAEVREVRGEYDVFGDGSVVTMPTPGHTPGHQSVVVDLGGETTILAADVAHRKVAYENEFQASFNWNLGESIDSLRKVKERARREDADVRLVHDRDDYEALQ